MSATTTLLKSMVRQMPNRSRYFSQARGKGEFQSCLFAFRRVPPMSGYQASQTSGSVIELEDTFEAKLSQEPGIALALNRILSERLGVPYPKLQEYTTQGGLPA